MTIEQLKQTQPVAWKQIRAGLPDSPRPESMASRSGHPTLRLDGTFLLSDRDPAAQARRIVSAASLASAPTIVVFGFGTGQIIAEVLGQADPQARICVAVLDPATFLLALETLDLAKLLDDPRLELLLGDLKTIARQLPPADEKMRVVVHPPLLDAAAPALAPLTQMAIELGTTQASRLGQFKTVLENISANLPRILDGEKAAALEEELRDRPVLLVAPGPSLDGQLETLARAHRPPLVALDTAVRVLLASGIRPDLAVTLDPLPRNLAKFEGLVIDFPLLYFEGARPEMVGASTRPLYACEAEGLLDRAHRFFGSDGRYESAGSSLCAALNILLTLQTAQIGLVGADLALTGGKTHAGAGAGASSQKTRREVPAVGGGMIETSESLWLHRRRLLRSLDQAPPGQVVDLRAGGAALPGCPREDLGQWLARCAPDPAGETVRREAGPGAVFEREAARRLAEEALAAAGFGV